MNIDSINELLERYYNAQTTEEEEEELKRFFLEEQVPPLFAVEKEMFMQLQSSTGDGYVPKDLEERLSKAIDNWNIDKQITQKSCQNNRVYHLQWLGSIAASILIVLSFGWFPYEPTPIRTDTCATPEEAYIEAQKALAYFSMALNKGMKQMETAQRTTENIEKNILKQLNKINE